MTYGHQIAITTRYPGTKTRSKKRTGAISARRLKRALHFIGFLAFWSIVFALTTTALLVVMIALVCLA